MQEGKDLPSVSSWELHSTFQPMLMRCVQSNSSDVTTLQSKVSGLSSSARWCHPSCSVGRSIENGGKRMLLLLLLLLLLLEEEEEEVVVVVAFLLLTVQLLLQSYLQCSPVLFVISSALHDRYTSLHFSI